MDQEVFCAIESGATVITAGRRLARVLTRRFHSEQRATGHSVWKTPDIIPLEAFLIRAWRQSLSNERVTLVLLDSTQEQAVWEQIIRDHAGDSLLQIRETARAAMEAWRIVQAYRLPVDGRFEATEDWSAFADWSRVFRKTCQSNNWIESARLADTVVPPSQQVFLAGFDDITPQQAAFFEKLDVCRTIEPPVFDVRPEHWKFPDATEEIRAAMRWARRTLEDNPSAQIGIIVPDLSRIRSKASRIAAEIVPHAFHVSIGPPLPDYPLIYSALLILEFALHPLTLPQAGVLLRSPFLAGAGAEATRRALLDARLRGRGIWQLTPATLLDAAGRCPQLQRSLMRLDKTRAGLPNEQRPSEWSRDFARLLEAAGWPGPRPLASEEFQVIKAWQDLLSSFAALDLATPALTFGQALDHLRAIAADIIFQIENEGAPIQIMGLLEASGLTFDHLWIMGLHDEALPPPAHPHPFLPNSLQREHGVPHSSAQREMDFAAKLLERLSSSAPSVVLSYPETDGDRALSPSPLVDYRWTVPPEDPAGPFAAAPLAPVEADSAPPLTSNALQSGGTRVFKDMAACPFRAFAVHRLAARPLDETDLGPSYKDRGSVVHTALQLIWTELGSHARLMELSQSDIHDIVTRSTAAALEQSHIGFGRDLEHRRLEKLLTEWLEIEKSRQPFVAGKPEQDRLVTIGGLEVRTRADRIDELPDGRDIILDYKTGPVKTAAWDGDRPDEPQLPLYCATNDRPIAAAAFVQIRTGELGLLGIAAPGVALPDLTRMKFAGKPEFSEVIAQWRAALEKLAADFRAGRADVDPKPDACKFCGERALCRIREFENDRG